MSLRDKIVNAPPVFRRLVVNVAEWDAKLEVRSLSVDAKLELGRLADAEGGEADVMAHLLISCVYDSDTGERVFTDDDREWIGQQDSAIIEPVATAALEISGLKPKALDDPKDDSSTTPNTGMSSSEPNG